MSELPEKQVKRLHALIQEAETSLAAAKELLISIIGEDGTVLTPRTSNPEDAGGKVVEGVFDGQKMAVQPDMGDADRGVKERRFEPALRPTQFHHHIAAWAEQIGFHHRGQRFAVGRLGKIVV